MYSEYVYFEYTVLISLWIIIMNKGLTHEEILIITAKSEPLMFSKTF